MTRTPKTTEVIGRTKLYDSFALAVRCSKEIRAVCGTSCLASLVQDNSLAKFRRVTHPFREAGLFSDHALS